MSENSAFMEATSGNIHTHIHTAYTCNLYTCIYACYMYTYIKYPHIYSNTLTQTHTHTHITHTFTNTNIPVLSDPLPPALSLGHLYKGSCATLPTMPAILQSRALKHQLAGWGTGPRQPELILEARMGTFPFSAKDRRNGSE